MMGEAHEGTNITWGRTVKTTLFRLKFQLNDLQQSTRCLVYDDSAELFERGFEVFDDFLSKNVGVGEIVRFFEAFVSDQKVSGPGKEPDSLLKLGFCAEACRLPIRCIELLVLRPARL
jgi:hypothetical protein